MGKSYICPRWPFLAIGERVKFDRGVYVARDSEEERQIESLPYYGVHIHDRDTKEEVEAQRAVDAALTTEPAIRVGRRGTK